MPGSSNFIGEFMILLGVFQSKTAISVIAFLGVVGAAYYALRLFITAIHNRVGRTVASREVALGEAVAIVPLVLVILVLAFYPQFGLRRSEPTVRAAIAPAQVQAGYAGHALRVASPMNYVAGSARGATSKGPHIDWEAFSPLLALVAGGVVVLLVGLFRAAVVRERIVPALTIADAPGDRRPGDLALPPSDVDHLRSAADRRPGARARHAVRGRRRSPPC